MTPAAIESGVKAAAEKLFQMADRDLAKLGFLPGAIVLFTETYGDKKQSVYMIHHVSWGNMPHRPHLWLHGYKKLGDGSFGKHVHSIGSPADCEVLVRGP